MTYRDEGVKRRGILTVARWHCVRAVWVLLGLWLCINLLLATRRKPSLPFAEHCQGKVLSRQRRFIYMDNERQLRLPTGSILAFSGVLSLPFLGNLPIGYGSGINIAVPLTIKFDDLGLTSPDNRFGYFDFLNVSSRLNFSRPDKPLITVPIDVPVQFSGLVDFFFPSKSKRSTDWRNFPGVNYAGGDREMIFQIVEDFLSSFGLDGKSCLLRTVCEMHEEPLFNHGFFGEVLQLLLSPSLAAYAEHRLGSYVEAEEHGKHRRNCSKFKSKCKFSLFSSSPVNVRDVQWSNGIQDLGKSYLKEEIISESGFRNRSHHRHKRFFAFGPQRRLIFPPTTTAVFTTTLNLPFWRDLPNGYKSQLSYSIPMSLNFDGLGLTSALNLFGSIPFLKRRKKRDLEDEWNSINYAGGDRELMYAVLINSLSGVGMDGEACLKRVICEIQEVPLLNYGLFGEILTIFLTPSLSAKAKERMNEFVRAEKIGKACGNCSVYTHKCPWSLFTNPGAGARYRDKKELEECHHRTAFELSEAGMDFVSTFRSKFRKMMGRRQWHEQWLQKPSNKYINEIAHEFNMKSLFHKY